MATKHGMHGTGFYKKWDLMKSRCRNKNNDSYHRYGDRGIIVCNRWNEFVNFKKDMYESYIEHLDKYGKENTTLDRIDNNKGYSKDNCKWSTLKEQACNRIDSVKIKYRGITDNIYNWSRKIGINRCTLRDRINRGWTVEESFETPAGCKR